MKKIFRFLKADEKLLLGAVNLVLTGAALAGAVVLKKKKDEIVLKDVLTSQPLEADEEKTDIQTKEE